MNPSNKLLSDITAFRTYSKFIPHKERREALEETINRSLQMDLQMFPKLSGEIVKAYTLVHELKVMPSMRKLQFAGDAILKNHCRSYNCSFTPIDDTRAFGEAFFLLLSGVGVGFSVQARHVERLPKVQQPREEGVFIAHDSIQGWGQAVEMLMNAYFYGQIRPVFDVSNIRAKGSYLVTTGAKAPGPEPLKTMLRQVEEILKKSIGRRLRSIEVHDIVCIIADCVLSGGIRRSACLSLFDRYDEEMLKCKQGEWWISNPWRARANNSAVLPRESTTFDEFMSVFKACKESRAGEPGFSFTSDPECGFNPCVSGDTKILTDDGYKEIQNLVGSKVMVWNGFEYSEVEPKITGYDQKLLTVTFSDGRVLNCTPYHKFYIAVGYRGEVECVNAQDLAPEMKLIKHKFPVIEHGEDYKYAYTQGFISAEGMDNYDFCWVYEPKFMCSNRLQGTFGKENRGRKSLKFNHEPLLKSFVPFKWNLRSKLDWLAGLFDGDGTELKEGGLQISSVDRKFLSEVQELLSTLSIQCKVLLGNLARQMLMPDGYGGQKLFDCQESYRLCIGAVQMQDLKFLGLKCERMSFDKTPQRDASQFVRIVSVVENGVADKVYCFNEPKKHMGIFNGILTGQCHEISLMPNQFCNLSTLNCNGIFTKKEFLRRVRAATVLGTIQAAYTDFPYLRPIWKFNTELDALIGVSMTGVADVGNFLTEDLLKEGAALVMATNETIAKKLGINIAARTTSIKPEGTSSCVLGSASGLHDRHDKYYIRRIRINKDDALYRYLVRVMPELCEDDVTSATGGIISLPQESPTTSYLRSETSAISLFARAIKFNQNWVSPGHRNGKNRHNVSVTINLHDHEWDDIGLLLWNHREDYTGISLLPFDGGSYRQMPFESIDESKYKELNAFVKNVDLRDVLETEDNTSRSEQLACFGGACER